MCSCRIYGVSVMIQGESVDQNRIEIQGFNDAIIHIIQGFDWSGSKKLGVSHMQEHHQYYIPYCNLIATSVFYQQ